jgi:tetratricopeptide (TPR) repeat protein
VATAWDLTFERLTPAGRDLLQLLSRFNPESVPRSLIDSRVDLLPDRLQAVVGDVLAFQDALRELVSFALVDATETAISMHRLVQLVVGDRLSPAERSFWTGCAIAMIDAALAPIAANDPRSAASLADLAPQALAALSHADSAETPPALADRLATHVGYFFHHRGAPSAARDCFRQAIKFGEKKASSGDAELATNYSNLGMMEHSLQNHAEAQRLLKRAIELDGLGGEATRPALARDYSNLAIVEADLGKLLDARQWLLRAIAIDEVIYPPDNPQQALDYANLASVEHDLGNLIPAIALLTRAIAIDERHCPADHPRLAGHYANLAMILLDCRKPQEARDWLLRAIAIEEPVYAASHPLLADRYSKLGDAELILGEVAAACRHKRQALEIQWAGRGESHPETQETLRWLQEHAPPSTTFRRAKRGRKK